MARGITRKIDELGRITLPMEYRKSFGVSVGETAPAAIHLVSNVIRIQLKPEKAIGLVRSLDELGRLVIPKEIRDTLQYGDRQEVDMYIEGSEICVRKVTNECTFCGSEDNLLDISGVKICMACAKRIASTIER